MLEKFRTNVLKKTTTATIAGMMLNNLMSRTVAVHVRYNSVSVHMPSSALTVVDFRVLRDS